MIPPDPQGDLLSSARRFCERELGPRSVALVLEAGQNERLAAWVAQGDELADAVLRLVHSRLGSDPELASEFFAFFFPMLLRASHGHLRREIKSVYDSSDLLQSVLTDAHSAVAGVEFINRRAFMALLLKRLEWKASDRRRSLDGAKRTTDVLRLDEQGIEPASREEPGQRGIDRNDSIAELLLRCTSLERRVLKGLLGGHSKRHIQQELGLSRRALDGSLDRIRALSVQSGLELDLRLDRR